MIINYRDRPEGSESKLNTYSDGFKVLKTIGRLYRTYKPFGFFGILALILSIFSLSMFIPVFVDFINTGVVPRIPTLVVSGFIMLTAIQSFFAGMILQTIVQKNKQDFEMQLQHISMIKEDR